jgi:hypothetical protein
MYPAIQHARLRKLLVPMRSIIATWSQDEKTASR